LRAAFLLLITTFVTEGAAAAPTPPSPPASNAGAAPPPVSPGRRAVAIAASVIPGVLVHGSGQWVLHQPKTGQRLLLLEGIGVGSALVSGAGLALTGASRYTVAPFAIGALAGLGLFSLTLLADVYGALAPDGGTGSAETIRPRLTVWTGLRYVHDPLFSHSSLLSHGFTWDTGPVSIAPSLDFALDSSNRRYELAVARRLLGKTANERAESGSVLDLTAGVSDHAYHEEGFGFTNLELRVGGRLDLQAIGPRLTGSFGEAEFGYARQLLRYDGLDGDATDELLARIGFGIYLGHPGAVHGEARVAYNHRRDTFAGGLHLPGLPAGYAGYVEQRTELFFLREFGAALEVQYGSAFVAGAFLLLRPGEHR
jgi:hypothetical protein